MAERKPVALVDGALKELPSSDFLPAANIPEVTAAHIHAATSKTTPVDADELGLSDSAASWGLKKLTFANLAAWVRSIALTGLSTATNAVITASDTVIGALGKLQKQISDHLANTTGAHAASAVSNTPAGNISATTVQAAINELDAEKFDKSGGVISGNVNVAWSGPAWGVADISATGAKAGSLWSNGTSGGVLHNAYYAAGYVPTYISTGYAAHFSFNFSGAGGAALFVAPLGAAGAAVTFTEALTVNGAGQVSINSGLPFGYGVGSGGTATQATSLTTTVDLNKPSGAITMFSPIPPGGDVIFTVGSSSAAVGDLVVASVRVSLQGYSVETEGCGAGYFRLRVRNSGGGTYALVPVIDFIIIKGAKS